MTETKGVHESFTDYQDAMSFFEKYLVEMAKSGWELSAGSGIQYLNDEWSVGAGWVKNSSAIDQEIDKIEGLLN